MILSSYVKLGLFIFLAMTFILLSVLRLTRQHKIIRDKIKYPLITMYFLLAIYDALYIVRQPIPKMIEPYYFATLYLSIAILLIRISVLVFFDYFLFHTRKYRAPRLLKEIAVVLLFTIAVLLIVQNTLKIQLTTLLATSAILTVVLGLALQETLGNLFAGLALHLDPPYQPGDWIFVAGNSGKVVEVTWRSTKLRTLDSDFVIIPNGQIAKEKVINHSYPRIPHSTRVHVAVSYRIPPNKVARVVTEALSGVDNVTMEPPPDVRLFAYQDFSIDYEIKFYLKDWGIVEPTVAAVRSALWYHFRRNDVEIPFPIRNVYLHDHGEMHASREEEINRLCQSLQKVYLFASLEDEERSLIAEHLHEMHFAQREIIIREGDRDDSFFIIDQGEVEVFITSGHGTRRTLNNLREGDFFGEMALLTGERRAASVQAVTDVRVYRLAKEGFREILERRPGILDEIGGILSRRKDQLVGLMAENTAGQAEEVMNIQEVKSRILSRIRNYFGL